VIHTIFNDVECLCYNINQTFTHPPSYLTKISLGRITSQQCDWINRHAFGRSSQQVFYINVQLSGDL